MVPVPVPKSRRSYLGETGGFDGERHAELVLQGGVLAPPCRHLLLKLRLPLGVSLLDRRHLPRHRLAELRPAGCQS